MSSIGFLRFPNITLVQARRTFQPSQPKRNKKPIHQREAKNITERTHLVDEIDFVDDKESLNFPFKLKDRKVPIMFSM
jgi:hypothetical protein